MVVTTLCRKCGEHLRIENKQAIASSRVNPVPSAVFPEKLLTPAQESAPLEEDEMSPPSLISALLPTDPLPPDELPLGLGDMMGFQKKDDLFAAWSKPPIEEIIKEAIQQAPTPPPAPATNGTLQKMREQAYYRQQYFKNVVCFECLHEFKVGRSSKAAACPACGVDVCLEDYDINVLSETSIRTRGDVLIRKNGIITAESVDCRDLKLEGQISSHVQCRGTLTVRSNHTINTEIHCQRLLIEKGCDVTFVRAVHAEEVEIQGRISGLIESSGQVIIATQGRVNGDITARSVSIQPGGQLDGNMNIVSSSSPKS